MTEEFVRFDFDAAAAYTKAANEAAGLLRTAAGQATTVAGIDLSGLGALGREFAAAWNTAWSAHAGTLGTAGALTDGYGQAITTWGRVLGQVDRDGAGQITAAGDGTDPSRVEV
ncbi:hypothetical protein ACIP5Y_40730 [Nocardia sp. NPDC088792]|uniref:hypothetical protein n=1 Tax=Nocardia sp. NPDC088792 TaxID=3364332 RepID=UPI003810A744